MDNACRRAGCSGAMVDGYCDTCGRAPAGAPSTASKLAATAGAAVVQRVTSTATNGSPSRPSSSAASAARTGASGSGRTGGSGTTGTRGSAGSHRGSTRGSRGATRRSLGAGFIQLEPLPTVDPMQSILVDPVVPEGKRFCPSCSARLNLVKGFCPMCGSEYSFVPTLKPGDVVAGQYEVRGAVAFGGLGWIYLGWDSALSRWVVLKGLLNSKDAAGAQAALAERQFLAAVKHPNIVGVYNFVTEGGDGYIVMEYVGGKTLKTIRKERGPLPVAEAIAYIHRILLAFGYLEQMGLVYCDFKPDNFMVEGDDVKLIDMGGVRRVDDLDGDVYGTKGYSAPEATDAPSFTSDLYTVARALAILIADFPFQSGKYEFSLPTPKEEPVFAQNESLYLLLLKATRKDPDERFQTADEMAAQLVGVLREIVSANGVPRSMESSLFLGIESAPSGEQSVPDPRALPAPKPDAQDAAAGAILAAASMTEADQVAALFERAIDQYPESIEAPLLLARARVDQGRFAEAEELLRGAESKDPFDWQVHWIRGISLLRQNKPKEALIAFDHVYSEAPGELAPKLALAFAAESAGDITSATRLYDLVSRTDPSFTCAAFGLARCRERSKDRPGAIAAYQRVPATSRRHVEAQMALARALIQPDLAPPATADLQQASEAVQALALDEHALHLVSVEILRAAIRQLLSGAIPRGAPGRILGRPLELQALQLAVERELRGCAMFATTRKEQVALIDAANRERPRTLI